MWTVGAALKKSYTRGDSTVHLLRVMARQRKRLRGPGSYAVSIFPGPWPNTGSGKEHEADSHKCKCQRGMVLKKRGGGEMHCPGK